MNTNFSITIFLVLIISLVVISPGRSETNAVGTYQIVPVNSASTNALPGVIRLHTISGATIFCTRTKCQTFKQIPVRSNNSQLGRFHITSVVEKPVATGIFSRTFYRIDSSTGEIFGCDLSHLNCWKIPNTGN